MPVAQKLLADPVPGRGPGVAQVIAAAHQIPQPLSLWRGRRHEAQLAAAVEPHELLGVTPIGLDPIAGADWDQRRRDHVTRDPQLAEHTQQVKPARARLIADRQALRAAETLDEPADSDPRRLDLLHLRLPTSRRERRGDDRELMHIQRNPQTHISGRSRDNVRHGWSSGCMRLWPTVAP